MYRRQLVCITGNVLCSPQDCNVRLLGVIDFTRERFAIWFDRVMGAILDYDKNELGFFQTPESKYTIKVRDGKFLSFDEEQVKHERYSVYSYGFPVPNGTHFLYALSESLDDLEMTRMLLEWCKVVQCHEVTFPREKLRALIVDAFEVLS